MKRLEALVLLAGVFCLGTFTNAQGYDPAAPWPGMRHDYLNSGRAEEIKPYQIAGKDNVPAWTFQTGGPIFSTPIIGADGTVYVGSADSNFYAITPDGKLKWSFRTGRLIDSAGAVSADGKVYVPSGDGNVHALDAKTGKELWHFSAKNVKADKVEMAHWFEGNVTLSPDGIAWAGNDDFCAYGIDPAGNLKYQACTGGMVWTAVPTDRQGRHFFCSLDMFCYGTDAAGKQLWKKRTWGIISASPAIGSDGTVYIASFDAKVYALDPATGKERWSFKTADHVYGSPAIARDGTIYIGSADGAMYALSDKGRRAELKWSYDTLDPIRSSPAVDGDGNIYFGNGDGKLFVLGPDGKRRWSIDLTESDRNDINASPALGRQAFYVAMQDGRVLQVPYDYCLRENMKNDKRCSVGPGEELPAEGKIVYFETPGGSSVPTAATIDGILPGNVVTLRLVVRENNETIEAGIDKKNLKIEIDPAFPHHATVSMDHRFLNIVPDGVMQPGQEYRVRVSGNYRKPGLKLLGHIWLAAGKRLGSFSAEMKFRTAETKPLIEKPKPLLVTHMSFYQPTIFPSVAQIGMDDLNFIMVPVENISGDKWLSWILLAQPDGKGGYEVAPTNRVIFPAEISLQGNLIHMEARDFGFDHAGDRFGFNLFRLSGAPIAESQTQAFANNSLYAEGKSLSMAGSFYNVPAFGTPLAGSAQINEYAIPAKKVEGFKVKDIQTKDQKVVVEYDNQAGIAITQHQVSVMLIDNKTRSAIHIDYPKATVHVSDQDGKILRTSIKIPWQVSLHLKNRASAIVFLDGNVLGRYDLK